MNPFHDSASLFVILSFRVACLSLLLLSVDSRLGISAEKNNFCDLNFNERYESKSQQEAQITLL